jgi:hypothetical protein
MVKIKYFPGRNNPYNLPDEINIPEIQQFSFTNITLWLSLRYPIPPYSIYYSYINNKYPVVLDEKQIPQGNEFYYWTFIPKIYTENSNFKNVSIVIDNEFIPFFHIPLQNSFNEYKKYMTDYFHTSFDLAIFKNYKKEVITDINTESLLIIENVKKNRFILLESIGEKLRYDLMSKYADLEITGQKIPGFEYPQGLNYTIYENNPPYNFLPDSNHVEEFYGYKKLTE